MTEPKKNETTNETITSEVWKQTFLDLATQHGIGAAAGYLERMDDISLTPSSLITFSLPLDRRRSIIEHSLWAAEQHFAKPVVRTVVPRILNSLSIQVGDRTNDYHLVHILDLLTKIKMHEHEFSLPGSIKKDVEQFLKAVVREYGPEDEDKAHAIVTAAYHHSLMDELKLRKYPQLPWFGSEVVIDFLKSIIDEHGGWTYQYLTFKAHTYEEMQHLVSHWAAAGKLEDRIKALWSEKTAT